jgi:DNA-binding winged helix-turn-helix (wHTH) protein/TolB-like protein
VSNEIRFGVFAFNLPTGELRRDGIQVKLQPQPAKVLAILTARPGEVVSREDLRQQVWADGTFVDFERGLNFCIAQIRSALGDSAESPRFIETLPRRGYRFVAPVQADTGVSTADRTRETAEVPERSNTPKRRWLAYAALLLAAGGAAGWYAFTVRHVPIRVAVVPFDNETGQDTYEGLARGVADATVARLAAPGRVERLDVIGNSAALRRPRSFRDLQEIGRDVHAEFVVLAQVKRDETRVRLIAHLIRVKDEAHVWAQTYDRPEFTLAVQTEIAESIASAVSDKLLR